MDVEAYFESLGLELNSLRNRIRQLIADAHWQTDGEWKESVVRTILRRHLPSTATVSRGFVVTSEAATGQLDVLIHDSAKPVVFQDSDLAFVTPDAVLGIVEVKSRVNPGQLGTAVKRIADNIELIRRHPNSQAFAALYAFEDDGGDPRSYLERVARAAGCWDARLDFAAIGDSRFLRYWHLDPETQSRMHQRWHSYYMPGLATGYFVHNVVDSICPASVFSNNEVWFPTGNKELHKDGDIAARWTEN